MLSALLAGGNTTANPIVIPSNALESANYQVTLYLTNWFGASRLLGAVVTVSSSTDTPVVNILGASSRIIRVYDRLELSATGSVSGCASSNTLIYSWEVYRNYVLRPITSDSKDPRKLVVKEYDLKSGVVYQCKVTAKTASSSSSFAVVDVYVEPGPIQMEVSGGYVRMQAIDKPLLLDARGSADLNVDPVKRSGADLSFSWSCTVISFEAYGKPCNQIFGLKANLTQPVAKVVNMTMGYKYVVSVVGTATDGRSGSAAVTLTPLSAGAATVRIQSKIVKINADSTLKLVGGVKAYSNQTISWDVFPSVALDQVGLTKPSKNASLSEVQAGLVFSLAVQPSVFTPGKSYTFRLSSTPTVVNGDNSASRFKQMSYSRFHMSDTDSDLTSYSEITIQVNAPPSSGSFTVTPKNGTEVLTTFTLASRDWIDDPTDYPLIFGFFYALNTDIGVDFTISTFSEKSYTNTPLPAGLLSMNAMVLCKGVIRDSMGAGITASQTAFVASSASPGQDVSAVLSSVLETQLEKAFASSNNDAVMKSINVIGSSISAVNCSTAPDCLALNRGPCAAVTQTCGPCLQGFIGISGPSNKRCNDANGTFGVLLSPCKANRDCLYNLCVSGRCASPPKHCPSKTPETVCSGHGACSYVTVTGTPVKNCTEVDVSCSANCACTSGYGGTDCSLDSNALKTRGAMRGNMCNALMKTLGQSTISAHLLETMTSSLLQVYNPFEVIDNPTRANCSELLSHMSRLASLGHLAKSINPDLPVTIANTISLFVVNNVDGSASANFETHQQNAVASVASLQTAILKSVVSGQKPSNVLTGGVRMTVTKHLPQDMANTSLSPPQTDAEKQYGAAGPSFRLPASTFTCPGSRIRAAAQMSMMQWGNNPYGSSAIPANSTFASPLSRFSNTVAPPKKKTKITKKGSRKPTPSPSAMPSSTTLSAELTDPYYIVIQFAKEVTPDDLKNPNFLKPTCGVQREGVFVKCPCNESAVSTTAITYTCYDRSFLCPKPTGIH